MGDRGPWPELGDPEMQKPPWFSSVSVPMETELEENTTTRFGGHRAFKVWGLVGRGRRDSFSWKVCGRKGQCSGQAERGVFGV